MKSFYRREHNTSILGNFFFLNRELTDLVKKKLKGIFLLML